MKLVTLNTSYREQNHHQFKKADDVPQKNIKQSALIQKENIPKLLYALARLLVKYNIPAAGVLSRKMAI